MAQEVRRMFGDDVRFSAATFGESVEAFVSAVRWDEWWIVGIGCAHVALAAAAIVFRRSQLFRAAFYTFALGLVYSMSHVNTLAAAHWPSFASQNYFDPSGLFLSTVVSAPLLLIATATLAYSLYDACSLMYTVGRMKAKANIRAAAAAHPKAD